MENRREFLKKAGIAGSLGTAGALTLKKEYVRPVVRLLEPNAAYAQTPAIVVGAAAYTFPVFDGTSLLVPSPQNTLTLTLDVPGASPPAVGSTFNVSLYLTNLAEVGTGWGTPVGIPPGATVTSDAIDNAAAAAGGGVVGLILDMGPISVGSPPTLNGATILPTGSGSFSFGLTSFVLLGVPGDRIRVCISVDADAGITTGGTPYPAQALGTWCFEFFYS